MPRVGFAPTIPVFERVKTFRALDQAATVIAVNFTANIETEMEASNDYKWWQSISHMLVHQNLDLWSRVNWRVSLKPLRLWLISTNSVCYWLFMRLVTWILSRFSFRPLYFYSCQEMQESSAFPFSYRTARAVCLGGYLVPHPFKLGPSLSEAQLQYSSPTVSLTQNVYDKLIHRFQNKLILNEKLWDEGLNFFKILV
jgi:hypothetical protein